VLVAIIREERPLAPTTDDAMEAGDELLFITTTEQEDRLQDLVAPAERHHLAAEG
jgi:trk system potassium uptake protein TrkA